MPYSTSYRLADYLLQTHYCLSIQETYLAELCNETDDLGEPIFQLINHLAEKYEFQRLDCLWNQKLTASDEAKARAAISSLDL